MHRRRVFRARRLTSPVVLIGVCLLAANIPYLIGWFHPDPLLQNSGLGVGLRPGVFTGRPYIDPSAGIVDQALGHLAATDWLHGHLPWWNPFEGIGSPLAGEAQNAAFFPLTGLLLFANGQVYQSLILELIAAYGAYALLRRLSISQWPAFVGAVLFGLAGELVWFRSGTGPIPFLPLILLGVEIVRERARDGRRTHWWIVAAGLGLSLVAGFPETAYLDGLLAALWALVRARGLTRTELRRYLSALVLGAGGGLALAAPALVSFADFLPHAFTGLHANNATHLYLPTPGVNQLFFPYVYGPLFGFTASGPSRATYLGLWSNTGGYLTVGAVLLAVFGLLDREHRPLKLALAGWSVLFVARSYGTPIAASLLGLIPGMSHVLAYRFMNPSVELAVAVLAAFGVRDLLERRIRPRRLLVAAGAVALVAILSAMAARTFAHTIGGDAAWEKASLLWGFGTIGALAVTALVATARPRGAARTFRRAALVGLVALLPIEAIAMAVVPELSAPRGSQRTDTALVAFVRNHIGQERAFSLGGAPLLPNYGSYVGISTLDDENLPTPKAFETLVATRLDPNVLPTIFDGLLSQSPAGLNPIQAFVQYARNYEALGVKFLLFPSGAALPPIRGTPLTAVYRDSLATVYELPRPAPYFRDATPGCRVTLVTQEQAQVDCSVPSTLIRDELFMPGWTARVDGVARQIGTTTLAQETVRLPAGSHRITYGFTPPHENVAWLALLLALMACLFATGLPQRFQRSRRGRSRIV